MGPDLHKTVFYLPHDPGIYKGAFSPVRGAKRGIGRHSVAETEQSLLIVPEELSPHILEPQHFADIKEELAVERFWLVDLVVDEKAVVQIIDHRNLTGINPLAGKTPMGTRPRFPEMGKVYDKDDVGLPRRIVDTVGPERFPRRPNNCTSETAALISLPAAYVGITILALGWCREKDPDGWRLGRFVSNL